jgi:hypothetical protein
VSCQTSGSLELYVPEQPFGPNTPNSVSDCGCVPRSVSWYVSPPVCVSLPAWSEPVKVTESPSVSVAVQPSLAWKAPVSPAGLMIPASLYEVLEFVSQVSCQGTVMLSLVVLLL